MQEYPLIPHPARPPKLVKAITAKVNMQHAHWLLLRWRIEGSAALILPKPAGVGRANGLWQTTCFEMFLGEGGADFQNYTEYNFSPSEKWNAYEFAGFRQNMQSRSAACGPVCTMRPGRSFAIFDTAIPHAILPQNRPRLSITAVIEEEGGQKSYWALAHGRDDAPDFHDPACFAAELNTQNLTRGT